MIRFITILALLMAGSPSEASSKDLVIVLDHHECKESTWENDGRLREAHDYKAILHLREGVVFGDREMERFHSAIGIEDQTQLELVGHYLRFMEANLLLTQGEVPELQSYPVLARKWLEPLKTENGKRQWMKVKERFLSLNSEISKEAAIKPIEQLLEGNRIIVSDFEGLMTNLNSFEALTRIWAQVATEEAKSLYPSGVDFKDAEKLLKLKTLERKQYVAFHEQYNFHWRETTWTKNIFKAIDEKRNTPMIALVVGVLHANTIYEKLKEAIRKEKRDINLLIDLTILDYDCMKGPITRPIGDSIRKKIHELPKAEENWLTEFAF